MYYQTENERQHAVVEQIVEQIDESNQRQSDSAVMIEASNPEGSLSQQNRRINSKRVLQDRSKRTRLLRRQHALGEVSKSEKRAAQKRKSWRPTRSEMASSFKRARGEAGSSLAQLYSQLHPGVIYNEKLNERNCLLRAISHGCLRSWIIQHRHDAPFINKWHSKSSGAQIRTLHKSKALIDLSTHLSKIWQRECLHGQPWRPPTTISEFEEALLPQCEILQEFNFIFAVVGGGGVPDSVHACVIKGAKAPDVGTAADVMIVFPIYTGHFFPANSFKFAIPTQPDGSYLCEKCLAVHKPSAACNLPCCMCKEAKCKNRLKESTEEPSACERCNKQFLSSDCLRYHKAQRCNRVLCEYCLAYYKPRKKLHHLITQCNVEKCKNCGEKFRLDA